MAGTRGDDLALLERSIAGLRADLAAAIPADVAQRRVAGARRMVELIVDRHPGATSRHPAARPTGDAWSAAIVTIDELCADLQRVSPP